MEHVEGLIEARVDSCRPYGESSSYVVTLTPSKAEEKPRFAFIRVSQQEAIEIERAIKGKPFDLPPLAYDLTKSVVEATGLTVERVVIGKIPADEEGKANCMATVHIKQGENTNLLECRASDGISISLRTGCPLLVKEEAFNAGAVRIHPHANAIGTGFLQMMSVEGLAANLTAHTDIHPETAMAVAERIQSILRQH